MSDVDNNNNMDWLLLSGDTTYITLTKIHIALVFDSGNMILVQAIYVVSPSRPVHII